MRAARYTLEVMSYQKTSFVFLFVYLVIVLSYMYITRQRGQDRHVSGEKNLKKKTKVKIKCNPLTLTHFLIIYDFKKKEINVEDFVLALCTNNLIY